MATELTYSNSIVPQSSVDQRAYFTLLDDPRALAPASSAVGGHFPTEYMHMGMWTCPWTCMHMHMSMSMIQ